MSEKNDTDNTTGTSTEATELKDNVVDLFGNKINPEQKAQELKDLQDCLDALEQAKGMKLVNVAIIGMDINGSAVVLDATQDIRNLAFMLGLGQKVIYQ